MTTPTPTPPPPPRGSDLRGLLRLSVDATLGVTNLVEAMHHTMASRAGIVGPAPVGPAGGLPGLIYRGVRGSARWVGRSLDVGLGALAAAPRSASAPSAGREAALAVLNGLCGDHLAESHNPLAIRMSLRRRGSPLALGAGTLAAQIPNATGRLLVLAHGLCMNDLQWQRQGQDHGEMLQRTHGYTPVYLHYNTGRHVSQNGLDFAALLDPLLAAWPAPVQELVIIGHSMGGLVARSACHHAQRQALPWLNALTRLVFLGTPHHGAALERGGRLVDSLFGISPYTAPFARLGQARSAGITDLRYGNLQQADWQGRSRHDQRHDDRQPTPLPETVAAYAVAATLAEHVGTARLRLHDRFLGDGLVPLASALGEHRRPALALKLPTSHRLVLTRAHHWDLLSHDQVGAQLRTWLA